MFFQRSENRGFTLIELLIVIAIVLILIAIALPNFANSMLRAKVARVMSDMRTIATGLESYQTDYQDYPTGFGLPTDPNDRWRFGLWLLSTPIPYITSSDIQDPLHKAQVEHPTDSAIQYNSAYFDRATGRNGLILSEFLRFTPQYLPTGTQVTSYGEGWRLDPYLKTTWWTLFSNGPDQNHGFTPTNADGSQSLEFDLIERVVNSDRDATRFLDIVYSPTNGVRSVGNIWRSGGNQLNTAGRLTSG